MIGIFKRTEKEAEDFVFTYVKQWLLDNWQKPLGVILLTSILSIPFIATFHEAVTINKIFLQSNISSNITFTYLWGISLIWLLLFLIIFQKIKYPKTPKNKVGVYIGISNKYEDKESKSFIFKIYKEIDDTLSNVGFGDIFHVISLDEYKSRKIIREKDKFWNPLFKKSRWKVNMDKIKWNFILFGSVKKSSKGGKEFYKLEPNYVVKHKPINIKTSEDLGKEFTSFLITQPWDFPVAEEMRALEVVTDNIRENILFSLGSSAYVSGQVGVAMKYHERLLQILEPRCITEYYLKTLLSRTKELLAIENNLIGGFYYSQGNIDEAIKYQEKSLEFKPNYYYANLSLAHHYYLKGAGYEQKVDSHLEEASRYPQDASFKLSKAFLKIERDKKFQSGIELYDEALRRGSLSKGSIDSVFEFIERRKKTNFYPYLIFIEGFVTYLKKDKQKGSIILKDFIDTYENDKEMSIFIQKAKKTLGINK